MNTQRTEPKYDEDFVNLGYLNRILNNTVEEKVKSFTTKNYNMQPTPPYYVGDTWTQGVDGNIYRCIKQRLVGEFNQDDWELASGNITKEDYSQLLEKLELITEQVDEKIQTYYQSESPSKNWETTIEKEKHIGDLWYDTNDNISKVYLKENDEYIWKIQDVPQSLYDKINSKKTIYTSKPSEYEKNDMWIVSATDTNIPEGFSAGDILIASETSNIYNPSHWSKKDNYTTKDYVDEKNNEIIEEIEKTYKPSILDTAKANAKELIDTFNNGEVIKKDGKYYVIDSDSLETATNVIVIGAGGIAFSNNGVNGEYRVAITIDGKINADMILTGSLLASLIKGGTLTLGGLDNKNGNFKLLDSDSNTLIEMNNDGIILSNGAKLIGGNGVLSNFTFSTGNYDFLGFSNYDGSKRFLELTAYIPDNLVIVEAYILLEHAPVYWRGSEDFQVSNFWGYARDIELYKISNSDKYYRYGITSGGYEDSDYLELSKISDAFGKEGFTGTAPKESPSANMSNTISKATSINIKNYLTVGKYNNFRIQTNLPNMVPVHDLIEKDINEKTGIAKATLCVIAYIK